MYYLYQNRITSFSASSGKVAHYLLASGGGVKGIDHEEFEMQLFLLLDSHEAFLSKV
jgi:hypothetical protein